MNRLITLRQAGGSVTATLPKDFAERYGFRPGDEVHVIETEQGLLISPYDPDFDAAVAAFEEVRRDYRNTLRALAD